MPENDAYICLEGGNTGAVILRPKFEGTSEFLLTVIKNVAGIYLGTVWGSVDPNEWWFREEMKGKVYFYASSGALCTGGTELFEAEQQYELNEGDQVMGKDSFYLSSAVLGMYSHTFLFS